MASLKKRGKIFESYLGISSLPKGSSARLLGTLGDS